MLQALIDYAQRCQKVFFEEHFHPGRIPTAAWTTTRPAGCVNLEGHAAFCVDGTPGALPAALLPLVSWPQGK